MKSYNCEECGELVNELGAFVKRSATRRPKPEEPSRDRFSLIDMD